MLLCGQSRDSRQNIAVPDALEQDRKRVPVDRIVHAALAVPAENNRDAERHTAFARREGTLHQLFLGELVVLHLFWRNLVAAPLSLLTAFLDLGAEKLVHRCEKRRIPPE